MNMNVADLHFKTTNVESILLLSIRFILGGILIYASHDKILDPGGFANTIYNYMLLPDNLVTMAAIYLPWFEFVLGAFLIFGIWLEGSVFMVNLLFIIFLTAITINIIRGVDIDCGCFGPGSETSHSMLEAFYRDVGILVMSLYLFIRLVIQKQLKYQLLKFN